MHMMRLRRQVVTGCRNRFMSANSAPVDSGIRSDIARVVPVIEGVVVDQF